MQNESSKSIFSVNNHFYHSPFFFIVANMYYFRRPTCSIFDNFDSYYFFNSLFSKIGLYICQITRCTSFSLNNTTSLCFNSSPIKNNFTSSNFLAKIYTLSFKLWSAYPFATMFGSIIKCKFGNSAGFLCCHHF